MKTMYQMLSLTKQRYTHCAIHLYGMSNSGVFDDVQPTPIRVCFTESEIRHPDIIDNYY